ncbi:glycoside hydrolase family 99-like domain-containing protein [Paucibacter sp. PLA-PC-4]|uniref:glycoside hydrolase family 99-like domain-containing protein n=1 Tax=Paucibacter sp. PLA-PC-4 TaxID=2993655 RepID=UPI00224A58D6|nr:glycoside hydrolase family 99-like domain-containing protein [Paucibacter sp. PLA-PC-4]MCX2865285.1 glycoside hydrolase family 99-like domain-containing protein [Paucibacter sp. PLA-PC-4]
MKQARSPHCLAWCAGLLLLLASLMVQAQGVPQVGAYYFPGWKNDMPGAPSKRPWEPIQKYPEKQPLIGWYDEGQPDVVAKQLAQMRQAQLDFLVFDWYWGEGNKPYLEHALRAFLDSPKWPGMRFALLWANHTKVPQNRENFERMVAHWCEHFLKRPDYVRIDGKPAVFVFSQQNLSDRAQEMGLHPRDLLQTARRIARETGVGELFIVGSAEAVPHWVTHYGKATGYDAYSTYNYHRGFEGVYVADRRFTHSFAELDEAYAMTWRWMMANSPVPYILPGTAGWNKRPWGGSKDPRHDDSEATPEEFEAHLRRLRAAVRANPEKTRNTVVLCCWNEHGEGSVIEPTREWGNSRIDAIRKVLKGN